MKHLLRVCTYYRTKDGRWYAAIIEDYWLQPAKVVKGAQQWIRNPEMLEKSREMDLEKLNPDVRRAFLGLGWFVDSAWRWTKKTRDREIERAKELRKLHFFWIEPDSANISVE